MKAVIPPTIWIHAEPAKSVNPKSVNQGVAPFCGARFTRLAKTIDLPGGTVELALDQGVLLGGGREQPFAEVEVELKEGEDDLARAFAEALAQEFGLKEQPKSKLARAMAL